MKPENTEVIEAPNTILELRKYYRSLFRQLDWQYKEQLFNLKDAKNYDYRDILEECTLMQLHTLYNSFVVNKAPIKLLRCCPSNHLAVSLNGMYVGIEPDGYAHS